MKHSLALVIIMFTIWVLWSGHHLLIGFGIVSCLVVFLLSHRMNIVDEEGVPVQLGVRFFIGYAPWLLKEIVRANIEVACWILFPRRPIRPTVVRVTALQKGDLARVIYANSITLTPGTVSIDMDGDQITVHALSYQGAQEDMAGEMNRRVAKLEESS